MYDAQQRYNAYDGFSKKLISVCFKAVLVDRTARSYWLHNVVCPSVRLSVCAVQLNDTSDSRSV